MIDELLNRLVGVKTSGRAGWTAQCPAHRDWDSSLSLRPDKDGCWLLACRAGCRFDAVVAELEVDVPGLRPDPHPPPTKRELALTDYRRNLPELTLLADIRPEPVRWLWPGRIPLGKITILDGDPGLGKSLVSLDLAARVSTGRATPDGPSGLKVPRGVVLLTCEDDLHDTVRPRLDAAAADASRIVHLSRVGDSPPTLDHLDAVTEAVRTVDAKLVVVDPFMAYVPVTANAHKDQDIRRALDPLASLAARARVAVLMIRHLNKAIGGSPLYRGGGSIGIIGAVRSGLILARDPDDRNRTVLASTKANLASKAASLTFSIGTDNDGVPLIDWHEAHSPHTAEALLAATPDSAEDRSAVAEAGEFLRDRLAAGPVAFKRLKQDAVAAGIALPTLRRAKARHGIESVKCGQPGESGQQWCWRLEVDHGGAEGDRLAQADHLRTRAGGTDS